MPQDLINSPSSDGTYHDEPRWVDVIPGAIAGGAAFGATIGSLAGPVGTVSGAILGAVGGGILGRRVLHNGVGRNHNETNGHD